MGGFWTTSSNTQGRRNRRRDDATDGNGDRGRMDVAIRGDRATTLTMQLGRADVAFCGLPRLWNHRRRSGRPRGARAGAVELRTASARRARPARVRPSATGGDVNAWDSRACQPRTVRARRGSRRYVVSGASLSAALIVGSQAFVMHAGGTAAYLLHGDEVSALDRQRRPRRIAHAALARVRRDARARPRRVEHATSRRRRDRLERSSRARNVGSRIVGRACSNIRPKTTAFWRRALKAKTRCRRRSTGRRAARSGRASERSPHSSWRCSPRLRSAL